MNEPGNTPLVTLRSATGVGLCAGAALIAGLFVTDTRAAAPRLARWTPRDVCALPVPDPVGTP